MKKMLSVVLFVTILLLSACAHERIGEYSNKLLAEWDRKAPTDEEYVQSFEKTFRIDLPEGIQLISKEYEYHGDLDTEEFKKQYCTMRFQFQYTDTAILDDLDKQLIKRLSRKQEEASEHELKEAAEIFGEEGRFIASYNVPTVSGFYIYKSFEPIEHWDFEKTDVNELLYWIDGGVIVCEVNGKLCGQCSIGICFDTLYQCYGEEGYKAYK